MNKMPPQTPENRATEYLQLGMAIHEIRRQIEKRLVDDPSSITTPSDNNIRFRRQFALSLLLGQSQPFEHLNEFMNLLNEQEQLVMASHLGLTDIPAVTIEAIADSKRVKVNEIWAIQASALKKWRDHTGSSTVDPIEQTEPGAASNSETELISAQEALHFDQMMALAELCFDNEGVYYDVFKSCLLGGESDEGYGEKMRMPPMRILIYLDEILTILSNAAGSNEALVKFIGNAFRQRGSDYIQNFAGAVEQEESYVDKVNRDYLRSVLDLASKVLTPVQRNAFIAIVIKGIDKPSYAQSRGISVRSTKDNVERAKEVLLKESDSIKDFILKFLFKGGDLFYFRDIFKALSPDEIVISEEDRMHLQSVLGLVNEKLTLDQGDTFMAIIIENSGITEYAREEGRTRDSINDRLKRAKKNLIEAAVDPELKKFIKYLFKFRGKPYYRKLIKAITQNKTEVNEKNKAHLRVVLELADRILNPIQKDTFKVVIIEGIRSVDYAKIRGKNSKIS